MVEMYEEKADYQYLIDDICDPYIKQRARNSLNYYMTNAYRFKMLWYVLSALGIILPAFATYLSCINASASTIGLITSVTSISSGILALFKCADKKTSYRNSAESLKSELAAYGCKCGRYKGKTEDEACAILFIQVEKIISDGYSKIAQLENEKK